MTGGWQVLYRIAVSEYIAGYLHRRTTVHHDASRVYDQCTCLVVRPISEHHRCIEREICSRYLSHSIACLLTRMLYLLRGHVPFRCLPPLSFRVDSFDASPRRVVCRVVSWYRSRGVGGIYCIIALQPHLSPSLPPPLTVSSPKTLLAAMNLGSCVSTEVPVYHFIPSLVDGHSVATHMAPA